jgi:hypothetical protein
MLPYNMQKYFVGTAITAYFLSSSGHCPVTVPENFRLSPCYPVTVPENFPFSPCYPVTVPETFPPMLGSGLGLGLAMWFAFVVVRRCSTSALGFVFRWAFHIVVHILITWMAYIFYHPRCWLVRFRKKVWWNALTHDGDYVDAVHSGYVFSWSGDGVSHYTRHLLIRCYESSHTISWKYIVEIIRLEDTPVLHSLWHCHLINFLVSVTTCQRNELTMCRWIAFSPWSFFHLDLHHPLIRFHESSLTISWKYIVEIIRLVDWFITPSRTLRCYILSGIAI